MPALARASSSRPRPSGALVRLRHVGGLQRWCLERVHFLPWGLWQRRGRPTGCLNGEGDGGVNMAVEDESGSPEVEHWTLVVRGAPWETLRKVKQFSSLQFAGLSDVFSRNLGCCNGAG